MKREPPPILTDRERVEIALEYQRKMRERNPLFAVWLYHDRLSSRGAPWDLPMWVPWQDAMNAINWGVAVLPKPIANETRKTGKVRKRGA